MSRSPSTGCRGRAQIPPSSAGPLSTFAAATQHIFSGVSHGQGFEEFSSIIPLSKFFKIFKIFKIKSWPMMKNRKSIAPMQNIMTRRDDASRNESQMVAAPRPTGPCLLDKLPTELLQRIFSVLFRSDETLGDPTNSVRRGLGPDEHCYVHRNLSAQVLRTCRRVYYEGRDVLYRVNTWYFELADNGALSCHPALVKFFPPWGPGNISEGHYLPPLRQIEVGIVNSLPVSDLRTLRDRIRCFVDNLLPLLPGGPRHLRVDCTFAVRRFGNTGEEEWGELGDWDAWTSAFKRNVDPTLQGPGIGPELERWRARRQQEVLELPRLLKTWLGRLHVRNVGTVTVTGLPKECAEMIKQRCHGSTRLDELSQNYESLEESAAGAVDLIGWGDCQESLARALMCCETDDKAGLQEAKRAVERNLGRSICAARRPQLQHRRHMKQPRGCQGNDAGGRIRRRSPRLLARQVGRYEALAGFPTTRGST